MRTRAGADAAIHEGERIWAHRPVDVPHARFDLLLTLLGLPPDGHGLVGPEGGVVPPLLLVQHQLSTKGLPNEAVESLEEGGCWHVRRLGYDDDDITMEYFGGSRSGEPSGLVADSCREEHEHRHRGVEFDVFYHGMPKRLDSFGRGIVGFYYGGSGSTNVGYEVFFPKDAYNHPGAEGGEDDVPNWFYYYTQEHKRGSEMEYAGPFDLDNREHRACLHEEGAQGALGCWLVYRPVHEQPFVTRMMLFEEARELQLAALSALIDHEVEHDIFWRTVVWSGQETFDEEQAPDDDWAPILWKIEYGCDPDNMDRQCVACHSEHNSWNQEVAYCQQHWDRLEAKDYGRPGPNYHGDKPRECPDQLRVPPSCELPSPQGD